VANAERSVYAPVSACVLRHGGAVRWTGGREPDRELVTVAGELCAFTVQGMEPFLVTWVDETAASHLVLDLSACTFFSAAGVALLLALHSQAERRAKHLVIVNPTKAIIRVLRICDLEQAFEIVRRPDDTIFDAVTPQFPA